MMPSLRTVALATGVLFLALMPARQGQATPVSFGTGSTATTQAPAIGGNALIWFPWSKAPFIAAGRFC